MSQKSIFEIIYRIILQRGHERIINTLDAMYDNYITSEHVSQKEIENATYLTTELKRVFKDAQLYKDDLFFSRGYTNIDKEFKNNQKISTENLKQDLSNVIDENTLFYNKKVVLTGIFSRYSDKNNLAIQLKKLGANMGNSITKNIDIVCLGWSGVGPSKMAKIEELKTEGIKIITISEDELYDILDKIQF